MLAQARNVVSTQVLFTPQILLLKAMLVWVVANQGHCGGYLCSAPACVAHDQGHVLDLPKGGHGRVAGQAQDDVRAGVVLCDLVDHGAVAAAAGLPADEVLAVDKVCARQRVISQGSPPLRSSTRTI